MKKKAPSPTTRGSRTDWKRIDRMRDQDIDYSDIPASVLKTSQRESCGAQSKPGERRADLVIIQRCIS
jgi:hypothetical protein